MKNIIRKTTALILLLALLCSAALPVSASGSGTDVSAVMSDAATFVYQTVKAPTVASVGGDWAVMGLARSGAQIPQSYYESYYAAVEKYVKDCGGVLSNRKYTEYARVILALTAIGKDARSVAGYDLTKPLGDFEKTVWQGVNGPVWALLALDSANYPVPENPEAATQATRQMYVDRILEYQLSDGGWNLSGSAQNASADPDLTGMVLQALAKYQDQAKVKTATDRALSCMSKLQDSDGGFSSWQTKNCESVVQMITALCELGIPLDDARFVKNGRTMLDSLLDFYVPGGGFVHSLQGSGVDEMACEQGLYCLAAISRAQSGKNSLYRMDDALKLPGSGAANGSTGRHADVKQMPVTVPGKTFPDIQDHPNQAAIEKLAARGIINGKSEIRFDPDTGMTRAEFAAIVVRGLGLSQKKTDAFTDVAPEAWYAGYVGTAYSYGIVNGVGNGKFNPSGPITRQEAATMVARAAKLCGLDTQRSDAAASGVLTRFSDAAQCADWAKASLAFCVETGILGNTASTLGPKTNIKRCEIAQMLCNLLQNAGLI